MEQGVGNGKAGRVEWNPTCINGILHGNDRQKAIPENLDGHKWNPARPPWHGFCKRIYSGWTGWILRGGFSNGMILA